MDVLLNALDGQGTEHQALHYLLTSVRTQHESDREDRWKHFKREAKTQRGYTKEAAQREFVEFWRLALEEKLLIAESAMRLHLELTRRCPFEQQDGPRKIADRVMTILPLLLMAFRSVRTKGVGYS